SRKTSVFRPALTAMVALSLWVAGIYDVSRTLIWRDALSEFRQTIQPLSGCVVLNDGVADWLNHRGILSWFMPSQSLLLGGRAVKRIVFSSWDGGRSACVRRRDGRLYLKANRAAKGYFDYTEVVDPPPDPRDLGL